MRNIFRKAFYLFLPVVLGALVGFIISNNIDYNTLVKPALSPPSWLFPVMWTIIYLLMGISYYRIKEYNNSTLTIDVIYYSQLAINLLWSIIFFVFKLRLFASVWIILLDIVVVFMICLFWKKDRLSVYLNLLYLGWILFATYLTIGIYLLN